MAAERERHGLTAPEVAARLRRDGPNVLPAPRPASPVLLLARQMTHFFALLLWTAAGLAYLGGMPQLAVAIVIVVLVNGAFAFVQEYRADRAGRRLRELLPARVIVRRDGCRTVVNAAELVAGDIVLLEAGDRVPADLGLLEVHSLALDESMLTGESVPVRPEPGGPAHAGTFVVEGEAETVVAATGARTRLAGIAALTRQAHRRPGPLAVQLRRAVMIIAAIAVSVGLVFFGIAIALGMPPDNGFLLAVGVTVALVPEGLLPTVTLSLARGAQQMARRNALVRKLESVETLGSTTFICTDKTGTLTRNEMAVVRAWTPTGAARVTGTGYSPAGTVTASPAVVRTCGASRSRGPVLHRPDHRTAGWLAPGRRPDGGSAVHVRDAGRSQPRRAQQQPGGAPVPVRSAAPACLGGGRRPAAGQGRPGRVLPRCLRSRRRTLRWPR